MLIENDRESIYLPLVDFQKILSHFLRKVNGQDFNKKLNCITMYRIYKEYKYIL